MENGTKARKPTKAEWKRMTWEEQDAELRHQIHELEARRKELLARMRKESDDDAK